MAVAAAAITPAGVRDGEHATLRALSIRRGAAVLGYCEQVCAPGHALDAASQAFAHFRAAVVASPRLDELDPEALLLSATRHAAAALAPGPPPGGRLRRGAPSRACLLMPELLAARADDRLSPADSRRADRHLKRCGHCQAAERRWQAAEIAYRAAAPDAPAELAIEAIERALLSAAPTNHLPGAAGWAEPHPAPLRPWVAPVVAVADPPELPQVVSGPSDVDAPAAAVDDATGHDPRETSQQPPAEHRFDDDLDATMAWALQAPDFEDEILATDLRDRVPVRDRHAGAPVAEALAPPAAAATAGPPIQSATRWRRLRRMGLPLAIAAIALVVGLSLVGTLAQSVHRGPSAPVSAPTIAPPGAGSSSTSLPAVRAHRSRHRPGSSHVRAAGAIARGAGHGSGTSAQIGALPPRAAFAPTARRTTPTSLAPAHRTPNSRAPSAPSRPVTAPSRTTPASTTPASPAPSAPAPAAQTPPPAASPNSPGGTPAPAP